MIKKTGSIKSRRGYRIIRSIIKFTVVSTMLESTYVYLCTLQKIREKMFYFLLQSLNITTGNHIKQQLIQCNLVKSSPFFQTLRIVVPEMRIHLNYITQNPLCTITIYPNTPRDQTSTGGTTTFAPLSRSTSTWSSRKRADS